MPPQRELAACSISISTPGCNSPYITATVSRMERTSKFLQSTHLHMSEHRMLAWKHSQYFFRHPLFLQLQPLLCRTRFPVMGS